MQAGEIAIPDGPLFKGTSSLLSQPGSYPFAAGATDSITRQQQQLQQVIQHTVALVILVYMRAAGENKLLLRGVYLCS
jgi:hypothetical protein